MKATIYFLATPSANLSAFVILGIIIVLLGAILRYFKQPYIIAYILAGILLGDYGFGIITDQKLITTMGDIGLILLMFFIGMEISLPELVKNWKVAVLGTFVQVIASVLLAALIGYFLSWKINQIVTIGFVISLSSSAIVIKLLQDNGEINTSTGKNVLSILLMQDILIVPMMIITNYLGGHPPTIQESVLQIIGGILVIGAILWIWRKKEIEIPFSQYVASDREIQVFVALIICFGCAVMTAFFGLSAALGAFVGGMVIHATRSATWFHDSLHAFRVMFVALFFVSVGMMIDLKYLVDHWVAVSLIIIAVYISNHFINTVVLHYFGRNWKKSLYGGALLGQVGELSFVLGASAYSAQIISNFTYQLMIMVISLTLLISPFWVTLTKKIIGKP